MSIINKENSIEQIKKEVYPSLLLTAFSDKISSFNDTVTKGISTSIYSFTKYIGDDVVIDVLFNQISKAILFFGVSKANVSDEVIKEACMFIKDEYKDLTIQDINYIIKKAKNGDFGEIYGHISGSVIVSWFKKYREEKTAFFEQKNENAHLSMKLEGERKSESNELKEKIFKAKFNFENQIKKS